MTAGERIEAYFVSCGHGSAEDIGAHFTPDAVIWDTNVRPLRGRADIGASWVAVRERWGGAEWFVDSLVEGPHGDTAAIEWSMTGIEPVDRRPFVFRGSEHYRLVNGLIDEIRQYWTFDAERLDTGLRGFDYGIDDGQEAADR